MNQSKFTNRVAIHKSNKDFLDLSGAKIPIFREKFLEKGFAAPVLINEKSQPEATSTYIQTVRVIYCPKFLMRGFPSKSIYSDGTSKEPVGNTWTGKQHNPKFFGQNGNNFLISAF